MIYNSARVKKIHDTAYSLTLLDENDQAISAGIFTSHKDAETAADMANHLAEAMSKEMDTVRIQNQDGNTVNVVVNDDGALACEIREIDSKVFLLVAKTDRTNSEVIGVFLGDCDATCDALDELYKGAGVVYGSKISAREYLKFTGKSIIGVDRDTTAIEFLNR